VANGINRYKKRSFSSKRCVLQISANCLIVLFIVRNLTVSENNIPQAFDR